VESKIHTVANAHGPRGDEVSRRYSNACAVHGRIRKSHGQQRLDLRAHRTRGVDHGFKGIGIGDAHARHEA
jgi:hypothetical protein